MSQENKTSESSSNENNNVYKTPPIRIGTGLHRSKLVSGGSLIKTSTRLSSALTTPTRVNISSSGLTPVSRTNSERYQSAYSRLGANRNTSSPSLNDPDAVADDTKGGKSSQTGTDTYRKYSAKRSSYPAVLSPYLGVTPIQGLKGYSSSEKLPGNIQQEDPSSVQKGLLDRSNTNVAENDRADRKGEELAVNSLLDEQEKLRNNTQVPNNMPLPAKMSPNVKEVNQETSPKITNNTEENDKLKTNLNMENTDSDNNKSGSYTSSIQSDKDGFTLQNYVIPPRRRHGNKSKETHDSPIEPSAVGNSSETDITKSSKEPESRTSGTVNSPVSSVIKTENINVIDYVDDIDGVPKPMQRTRRRLTKRKMSFKKLEDDEYIGFASLPEQVHRKAVRRGFEFTLMVVGETGLGKSTLINSLFLTDLYKDRKVGKIEERVQKTVELEKKELEIEERGVKLKLTIVDTPGFNDAVNAEESWKPIVSYIDKQFESYFKAESGLNRKNIHDTRVHCCLYFISPYGHGLRPVDILVMKKLHHKVNIVPLVAKADMLTKKEIKALKEKVLSEIQKHRIQIYQFPDCDSDEDEDFKQQDQELKKAIPFAVVGSNTVVEAGGKKIRGRMYPWGIVEAVRENLILRKKEVENPSHCDFVKLRQMLISTHMQDLKDVTCDVHYENYRAEHISEQITGQQKERGKLKRESVTNMDKMMDTEKLLQEKEAEIKRMQEMLAKMQSQLNQNSPKLNGKVAAI